MTGVSRPSARVVVAGMLVVFVAATVRGERSPNVILILADDMGLGDLSCLNGGLSRTPNLDRLKTESVWFRHAYSASAVCAPARAALLTGRYPQRTGVVTLNMETYPALTQLRSDETTIADVFRAGGYKTGMIGKWHLGIGAAYHPLARGFDEFEGFIGHRYVPSYFDYQLDIQDKTRAFSDRYLTNDLSTRAINFVRRHHDVPFFLHLAHYAPHRPIEAPDDRVQPYLDAGLNRETATVYAMIEMMDAGIGQLLAAIDRLDLREQTVIIFASDNGPDPLVETRFNLGLRGTKYTIYEGGIRVPLMIRWPGHLKPSQQNALVHFTDLLPTLIDLCQLAPASDLPFDGASFAPALSGESSDLPTHRFWQWNRGTPRYTHNAAIREGTWKLVRPFVTRNLPKEESTRAVALYDLTEDPTESRDVSREHPDRARRMSDALKDWCRDVERDRTRQE